MKRRKRNHGRPLSQTGFNRLPLNPKQRVAAEGGVKERAGRLDAFNELAEDRYLTPTNGWRKLNVKRSRAQMIVAHIMNGGRMSSRQMKQFLIHG